MAVTYQETGDTQCVRELRTSNILMLGVIGLTLAAYAYFHKEPAVNADEIYPVAPCFTALPESVQRDFLLNREYVLDHPNLHQNTVDAMLGGYCPEKTLNE